ncbi:biotin/lipoyl-binding protein [Reinekea marina]|uniref:Efflux RND transporter periplasmic adaptor subunit n=1 Tax=Reinekea marina TaxID=1310421 RepID=A0ABV7WTF3_9GAMM|nr:biotin/lipoyl-binding protein [Reinekea marina]MDN3647358.1 biotin/lipoyl-binding protein [Reinekea marina]
MLNKILIPAIIIAAALIGYQLMNADEAPSGARQSTPAATTKTPESSSGEANQTPPANRGNRERPANANRESTPNAESADRSGRANSNESTESANGEISEQTATSNQPQRGGGGGGLRSGVLASQGATAVEVQRAVSYEGASQLKVFGVIDAQEKAIITAQSNATVTKILVKEGEKVEPNQAIAQLTDSNITAALAQKQASLSELEARLRNEALKHENDKASLAIEKELLAIAKNSVDRFSNLGSQQLSSSSDYESALKAYQAQLMSVQNRELTIAQYADTLAQSNAQRASLQSQIEQSQLLVNALSPSSEFAGVVAKLPINQGQILKSGETLAELYNPSSLAAYVRVPLRYRLDNFDLTNITATDASGRTWLAQAIRPISESGAQRITFTPEFPLASAPLPGTHLALTLNFPIEKNAVEVPITAVYDQQRVYLFQRGTISPVDIELIGQTDQGFLIAAPELSNESAMIVTTRLNNPITGMAVSLVQSTGGRP